MMEQKNIVLIGMMGSGKTTIGKALSQKINRSWIDIDQEITKQSGKTVPQIFSEDGEATFRKWESKVIAEVSKARNQIISTGGGSLLNDSNVENLACNGIFIWLNRSAQEILRDLKASERPLILEGNEKFIRIYDERYDLYKKTADLTFDNTGDLSLIIDELVSFGKEQKLWF